MTVWFPFSDMELIMMILDLMFSFEETPNVFFKAARHGELDNTRGVSANVMCGQELAILVPAFEVVLDINKFMSISSQNEWEHQ